MASIQIDINRDSARKGIQVDNPHDVAGIEVTVGSHGKVYFIPDSIAEIIYNIYRLTHDTA